MSYFLKIDGIAGESSTLPYLHWIEVESFAFETESSANTHPTKVMFAAKLDSSFPKLRLAALSGKPIPSAIIAGTLNSSQLQITLTDCIIASVQASDVRGAPHVRFSLSCHSANTQHGHVKAVTIKQFSPVFGRHIP